MSRVVLGSGVGLEVQDLGAGRPVVFLPGGAMTHRVWDHQVAGLMGEVRCLAVDPRGCGRSDVPNGDYSVDVYADDVADLAATLGLGGVIVVGHGLGAHVALRTFARHRGLLAGLVLISAAPWFVGERGDQAGGFPDDLWATMRTTAMEDRANADLRLIDDTFFHRAPSEAMRFWCLSMALEWPLPVFAALAPTLAAVDHRELLGEVDVPVLLLHGRHDTKMRYEGAIELVEALSDARLVTLEDSAHVPHLEQPTEVTEAIADFLRTLPPWRGCQRADPRRSAR